jgi:hypothetical protein
LLLPVSKSIKGEASQEQKQHALRFAGGCLPNWHGVGGFGQEVRWSVDGNVGHIREESDSVVCLHELDPDLPTWLVTHVELRDAKSNATGFETTLHGNDREVHVCFQTPTVENPGRAIWKRGNVLLW